MRILFTTNSYTEKSGSHTGFSSLIRFKFTSMQHEGFQYMEKIVVEELFVEILNLGWNRFLCTTNNSPIFYEPFEAKATVAKTLFENKFKINLLIYCLDFVEYSSSRQKFGPHLWFLLFQLTLCAFHKNITEYMRLSEKVWGQILY